MMNFFVAEKWKLQLKLIRQQTLYIPLYQKAARGHIRFVFAIRKETGCVPQSWIDVHKKDPLRDPFGDCLFAKITSLARRPSRLKQIECH
jgi:hypothetical protein